MFKLLCKELFLYKHMYSSQRKQSEARMQCDPPCCNDSVRGIETMQGSILKIQSNHTNALSLVHDQVQCEILDEVVSVIVEGLKSIQHQSCKNIANYVKVHSVRVKTHTYRMSSLFIQNL